MTADEKWREKKYWPFETVPEDQQAELHKTQIALFQKWYLAGYKPYVEKSNMGVENGELTAELIYRGPKLWELFLMRGDVEEGSKMLSLLDAAQGVDKWLSQEP